MSGDASGGGADEEMVAMLQEMGPWPGQACRAALQLVGNNLEGAAELLLGGLIPPGAGFEVASPPPPGAQPGEAEAQDDDGEEDGDEDGPNAADLMATLDERPEYAEAAAAAIEALAASPPEQLRAIGLSEEHVALLTSVVAGGLEAAAARAEEEAAAADAVAAAATTVTHAGIHIHADSSPSASMNASRRTGVMASWPRMDV